MTGVLVSPNPFVNGDFGDSVGVSGTNVIVGAANEVASGIASGEAYIFSTTGGPPIATLTSPNPQGGGEFGFSVAVNGVSVVVGANGESASGFASAGHAYLFFGSSTATVVFDASTSSAWSNTETTGGMAYDTAAVTTSGAPVATGTVSYTFYTNNICSGTGSSAGSVTLGSSGVAPNSNTAGPLAAGSYSFQAFYSGDNNYLGSTSACEPFSVNKASTTTATSLFDSTTGMSVSPGGAVSLGDTIYDTSITGNAIAPFSPLAGSVSYTFFTNAGCIGTGSPAGGGSLVNGLAPQSSSEGPLAAGSYSFQAVYSGDNNYLSSTSACEPFTVNAGSSSTATVVYDFSNKKPWSGAEVDGSSAYDKATVTGVPGITPSGTVVYSFWTNGVCSGTVASTQTVSLNSAGNVPNSTATGLGPGSYSFSAVYSGDSNYFSSTSTCEPFTIIGGTVGGVTLPVDKLSILAPYLIISSLLATLVALTVAHVRWRKSK